ncbi:replication initiator protein [Capybara microvirus Cap1_SP_151]|nr:replication initiator protein [Capybara microvirus Cap1_SP_151]
MQCFDPFVVSNIRNPLIQLNYKASKKRRFAYWIKFKDIRKDLLPEVLERIKNKDMLLIPCGRCFSCRSKKAMSWTIRNYFESEKYDQKCFITATYNEFKCPRFLVKKDLQLLIKQIRRYIDYHISSDMKIKYFACGEYGGQFGRPHFHILLYGFCFPKDHILKDENGKKEYISLKLTELWNRGIISFSDCVDASHIKYTCGYVQKKLFHIYSDAEKKLLQDWIELHPDDHFQDSFITCSKGIGLEFFDKNKYNIYNDNEFLFHPPFDSSPVKHVKPLPYFDYRMQNVDYNLYAHSKFLRSEYNENYYKKFLEDDRSISEIMRAEEDYALKNYKLYKYIRR